MQLAGYLARTIHLRSSRVHLLLICVKVLLRSYGGHRLRRFQTRHWAEGDHLGAWFAASFMPWPHMTSACDDAYYCTINILHQQALRLTHRQRVLRHGGCRPNIHDFASGNKKIDALRSSSLISHPIIFAMTSHFHLQRRQPACGTA